MFVVRAVRDYPMSLKPGRLYRVRVNACTAYMRGRQAPVRAYNHLGLVGYPSYGVTLLRNTFSGLWFETLSH